MSVVLSQVFDIETIIKTWAESNYGILQPIL